MRFAAQIDFRRKDGETVFLDGEVVSGAYLVGNYMTGVEYDVFNPNIRESEKVKSLPEGHYFAFMTGVLQVEEAGDPEVGMSEPSYIFLADDEDIDIYELVYEKTGNKATAYQKLVNGKENTPDVHHGGQERRDK